MTNVATAAVATETKTYDRPYLPKGQYFAMLREQGLLKPRQPKAKVETAEVAEKSADEKQVARSAFARRKHFANKAKAAKAAGGETAPKKVYDTPFLTRGQFMKKLREEGKLAPRQPKTVEPAQAA